MGRETLIIACMRQRQIIKGNVAKTEFIQLHNFAVGLRNGKFLVLKKMPRREFKRKMKKMLKIILLPHLPLALGPAENGGS